MNKTMLREWVAALRSGKYPQGRDMLGVFNPYTKERRYCPLGVACDLFMSITWGRDSEPACSEYILMYVGLEKATHTMPLELVKELTGSSERGPAFRIYHTGMPTSLVALNDKGTPFTEIADIIEKEFDL